MGKVDRSINPVFEFVRFGSIAFHRKFVTKEQIQQALVEQVEDNVSGRPHRLLGTIFREKGWITGEQEAAILKEMGLDE